MRVAVIACFVIALGQAALARDLTVVLDWPDTAPAAELVAVARDRSGAVLDSYRSALAQDTRETVVPLPSLSRQTTTIQLGVLVDGTMRLQSARAVVEGGQPPDRMQLSAVLTAGFTTQYLCDSGRVITIAPDGAGFVLDGAQRFTPTALTGQYSAEDDTIANRIPGLLQLENATDGVLASCQPIPAPPLLPLNALGPEGATGAWRVETGLSGSVLTLQDQSAPAKPAVALPTQISRLADDLIAVSIGDHTLSVRDQACHLPRTDMPFPFSAVLTGPGGAFAPGCAGDPLRLLEGAAWQVTQLLGRDVPRGADGATAFSVQIDAGRLSGRTSCNRYLGRAAVVNATLQITELGATRLACPVNLSNLEIRFLDALEAATGIVRLQDGGLVLYAGAMAVLVAQR